MYAVHRCDLQFPIVTLWLRIGDGINSITIHGSSILCEWILQYCSTLNFFPDLVTEVFHHIETISLFCLHGWEL